MSKQIIEKLLAVFIDFQRLAKKNTIIYKHNLHTIVKFRLESIFTWHFTLNMVDLKNILTILNCFVPQKCNLWRRKNVFLLLLLKKSRARVTIGGQCVLLQISLKIKRFGFFKAKITVWITSFQIYFWTTEKFCKILETRLQSSKIAPKWPKNCKINDVDKSTLVFGFQ